LSADYQISSLRFGGSATTPNWVSTKLDVDWNPSAPLHLTLGLLYSGAEYSDSGSTTLFMPRVAARYDVAPALALFGWFAPELRAPSYRNRIMRAPFVDRRIALRPERVPVNVAVGARYSGDATTLEARIAFETAANTPVVVAEADTTGALRYDHVDTRTMMMRAIVQTQPFDRLGLVVEAEYRDAVVDANDAAVPMVPQIDARVRGEYRMSETIGLTAAVRFESEQTVTLEESSRTIPSRLLLDVGGDYRLSNSIGIFAEITNLLGADYQLWDGYVAPGLEARGGVRITF
jgi:outer membrane cobalamin receptor